MGVRRNGQWFPFHKAWQGLCHDVYAICLSVGTTRMQCLGGLKSIPLCGLQHAAAMVSTGDTAERGAIALDFVSAHSASMLVLILVL